MEPYSLPVGLQDLLTTVCRGRVIITSPPTPAYNCVAWAIDPSDRRIWWPGPDGFWPSDCPRDETLEAFVGLFEKLGFERCTDRGLERACDKIVIYVEEDGTPSHVARQLETGSWTSKLGRAHDVEHDAEAWDHLLYGTVGAIMKRPRST